MHRGGGACTPSLIRLNFGLLIVLDDILKSER
jgi:hypothetical protein